MIHLKKDLVARKNSIEQIDNKIKTELSRRNYKLKDNFTIEVILKGGILTNSAHNLSIAKGSEGIHEIADIVQAVKDFFPNKKAEIKFEKHRKVTIIFNFNSPIQDPFTFINFTNVIILGMTPGVDKTKIYANEAIC